MPTFTSIAEALLEKARQLDAYIEANGLPSPSFAHDSLASLPAELEETRTSLADGSNDLKKLAQGPGTTATEISFTVSIRGVTATRASHLTQSS